MTQFFRDACKYLGAVFWEGWKWVFSIFDILGIVLFLLPRFASQLEVNEPLIQSIGITVFLLSFAGANLASYRELLRQTTKKPAHITIQNRSVEWRTGGTAQGMPTNPFACTICLDVKNEGDEPGRLNSISVDRMDLRTTLASNDCGKVLWYRETNDPNQQRTRITFPYPLKARDWDIRLVCHIVTEFLTGNYEEWAKRFGGLSDFSIALCYEYETISGEKFQEVLVIRGSFAAFRKRILKGWVQSKHYNLFFAATDLDALVDNLVE